MTIKEMQKRVKELSKLYKVKDKSFDERIKINREIIYLEMQIERIKDNN